MSYIPANSLLVRKNSLPGGKKFPASPALAALGANQSNGLRWIGAEQAGNFPCRQGICRQKDGGQRVAPGCHSTSLTPLSLTRRPSTKRWSESRFRYLTASGLT